MEFTILPVTPYQQNCSLVWDIACWPKWPHAG